MSAEATLQAEVERLRAEVEGYKQREVESLKAQLAAALLAVDHYRGEAHRINAVAQQIAADLQAEISRLRMQLETKEQVARQMGRDAHNKRIQRAHTSRN